MTIDIVDETIETSVADINKTIKSETIGDFEQDNVSSSKTFPVPNLKKFKCKMYNFALEERTDLKYHKKTIYNGCFLCFSTFSSRPLFQTRK